MNSVYLFLIAICFSAGVATAVIKSENPQSSKVFMKIKGETCIDNNVSIDPVDEIKPINIFLQ